MPRNAVRLVPDRKVSRSRKIPFKFVFFIFHQAITQYFIWTKKSLQHCINVKYQRKLNFNYVE